MDYKVYIYILIAGLVSSLIRVVPTFIIRTPIKNQFIKSFLFYVPYVTLAAMTFPAIVEATQSPVAGIIALVVGIVISWFGAGLLPVAGVTCLIVFVTEWLLGF